MSCALLNPPKDGVTVRMYRQGLGDCFLLAFDRGEEDDRPCFVLIDCGVLVGTEGSTEKMRRVALDLERVTGGRIDVLVATHQHWDHLSGFEAAREIFSRIDFDEVWVAWTEDPHDPLACRLRRHREIALRALRGSVERLNAAGSPGAEGAQALESLLGFYGELGAAEEPTAIQRAMAYVLERGDPPRFRRPGEGPLSLPGVRGAGVFVLGPPYDERLLLRSDPARRGGEVYERKLALGEETAFFAALLGTTALPVAPDAAEAQWEAWELEEMRRRSFPFDAALRLDFEAAKETEFFRDLYFGAPGSPEESELLWRRIDGDWLRAAGDLALQLDSDTNNTSLALAFELSPGGKVLLFPGDAQVGNWLSWHDLTWRPSRGPAREVSAAELLRRTVLYKVGHHASHNATPCEKGLDLMTSPELVAMIPVDEAMARKPKGGSPKGWDMPYGPLLERLVGRTDGRVIRLDRGKPERPPHVPVSDWVDFDQAVTESDLYLQIDIERGE
jgi:hypothetical protein